MLGELFRAEVYKLFSSDVDIKKICEVRLRLNKPISVSTREKTILLRTEKNKLYLTKKEDIDFAVGVASGFSVYAVNDMLVKGFLHFKGGVRIGVTGDGVSDGERLITIKNISGLLIRVPHEVMGFADSFFDSLITNGRPKNTLIISPPGCGKTTMLRELARRFSKSGFNVLVIDERYEIAASTSGITALDVGENTDVISGVSKTVAYENTIRSMSPDIIITDEVFSAAECKMVADTARSGVAVCASVHAESLAKLKNNTDFEKLLSVFDCFVTLSKTPLPGTVTEVRL